MGNVNKRNYLQPRELKYKSIDQHTYVDNIPIGCWAVRDLDILNQLQKQSYNFNVFDESNKSPLHHAIDFPDAYEFLLSTNVPINAIDKDGNTALHYAVLSKNELPIKILLSSICIKNYAGYSPFHLAVKESKHDIVCCVLNQLQDSLFLKKSYLINDFLDANQMSPVHHAIKNQDFKMLAFFKDFIDKEKSNAILTEYGKENYMSAVKIMQFLS